MITLLFCLRRRSDFTRDSFQAYWRDHHAPLVREVAAVLRIRRYIQSHAFDDPRIAGPIAVRGATACSYDGIAELHWDSIEDILAGASTAEGRDAGRRLLADERRFIDLANSPLLWVRNLQVV